MGIPKKIQPHDLLLVMNGVEDRLQLILGQPVAQGYVILASRQWTVPGQSVRFLAPGIRDMLNDFGATIDQIAKIACVRGPGSFTGLRLVLAAAEGLAAGRGLPMAGLDYLSLLARGVAPLASGPLHVLTYARRGLVYAQSFDGPDLDVTAPLAVLSLDQAAERMQQLGPTALLLGTGLRRNGEFFAEYAETNPGHILLDRCWDNPSPDLLLAVAAEADYSRQSMEPIYVRPSDAEDNLAQIAGKRGLDPEAARKRFEELKHS